MILFPIRTSYFGVYNDVKNKIFSILVPLIKKPKNDFLLDKNTNLIRIKLCGDGTNIGLKINKIHCLKYLFKNK